MDHQSGKLRISANKYSSKIIITYFKIGGVLKYKQFNVTIETVFKTLVIEAMLGDFLTNEAMIEPMPP